MRSVLIFSTALLGFVPSLFSQTAPPSRLKYFGFALVDCALDDPNDTVVMTNYITEVDSFSNIAQLYVSHYADTIIDRVNLMNAHCVKPILSTSGIFVYLANSNGPSGSNYDLYPDYLTRWNTFKTTNASVLNSGQIEMIYVCDEPTWNGLTFGELDTICTTIKNDFPDIPLLFVEAYTMVAQVQVPLTVDWIGFDHYGIYDVSTDPSYLAWLDTLKSRRSRPDQKIFLVFDDEWNAGFWPAGWQPDTMEQVVEHYYDLALADTTVIGLAGFTWPGIAPGWLGARSLPQNVIDKTVQIGKMIKANYDPCNTSGVPDHQPGTALMIYPNPVKDRLNLMLPDPSAGRVIIYNAQGKIIKDVSYTVREFSIPLPDLSSGIYFYRAGDRKVYSGKFIKE